MEQSWAQFFVRRLSLVMALALWSGIVVEPDPVWAQDSAAAGESEPAGSVGSAVADVTTPDDADNGNAGGQQGDAPAQGDDGSNSDVSNKDGSSNDAPNKQVAPPSSAVVEALTRQFGVDPARLGSVTDVQAMTSDARRTLHALAESRQRAQTRLKRYKTSSTVLADQLDDHTLPDVARQSLARKGSVEQARADLTAAIIAGLDAPIERRRRLVELLDKRVHTLQNKSNDNAADQPKPAGDGRLEQAEAAQRAALDQAERARAREAKERDKQVRRLISSRREVLEKTAKAADVQSDQIQQASAEHDSRVEDFAKRREQIEAKIAALPTNPSREFGRQNVDPLFDDVLASRGDVRDMLEHHQRQLTSANRQQSAAQSALDEAQQALDEANANLDDLGATAVGRQQLKLADARLALHRRRLEAARDLGEARRNQLELDRDQLHYYNQVVARLLAKITNRRRDQFYALFDDANWHSAWFGVRQALSRALRIAEQRVEQVLSLPQRLASVSLWGWIIGLLVRALFIVAVVYVGRNYTDAGIRKLTHTAFGLRFFQRRAALTIKTAEVIRSVIRPVILYVALSTAADYVIAAFPEWIVLEWGVDSFFIYALVMRLIKVLVLPRRYREESGRTPAPDLARLGANPMRSSLSAVDVISMELDRARKLVRSVQIVLVFWLLEFYVPHAVITWLGPSVITWLLKALFVWGLIAVVYLVLSTWRDDIANVFARLAKDRLPRAVDFVQTHKDRFYGVLVIAVAVVYVGFREIGEFASSQAKDTKWSKRLSNFVFRKRIEMQRKDAASRESTAESLTEPLPDDYVKYFRQMPLEDQEFKVERHDQVQTIIDDIDAFLGGRPQGSVAISAEQGMGKTSLVNDIVEAVDKTFDDIPRRRAAPTDKVANNGAVLDFVADLFELDDVPDSRAELVDRVCQLDGRVMIVDDCHHFFVREIGGFSGLDTFLEVVNLTDHLHYWVLTFNAYAWTYINRVSPRAHYFGRVVESPAWTDDQIQELIQSRNAAAGWQVSFTDLVVTHDEGDNDFYEIIKTANGYFRLLHEFSGGNPMVALEYWRRSVAADGDGTIQVRLFRKPSMTPVKQLSDENLFALSAIAQHGELEAAELAEIINAERSFCEMALNYFEELDIVELDDTGRRAHISPLYFRQVVSKLAGSNFLWD